MPSGDRGGGSQPRQRCCYHTRPATVRGTNESAARAYQRRARPRYGAAPGPSCSQYPHSCTVTAAPGAFWSDPAPSSIVASRTNPDRIPHPTSPVPARPEVERVKDLVVAPGAEGGEIPQVPIPVEAETLVQ